MSDDIIQRLAADSYRARQLLRLTCRRYYAMLGDYCDHKNATLWCGDRVRAEHIKKIYDILLCRTRYLVYTFDIFGHCIQVTQHIHVGHTKITPRIVIRNGAERYVCIIHGDTNSPPRVWATHEIYIEKYKYVVMLYDENSAEYLRDNLPELRALWPSATL